MTPSEHYKGVKVWVDLGWKSVFILHCSSISLHISEVEMVLSFTFILQLPGLCYPEPLLQYLGQVLDPDGGCSISSKEYITPAVL